MRIGVDASCWANGRGYGRFARELLRAMVPLTRDDEFICFADARAAERFDLRDERVRLVRVPQSVSPTQAAAAQGYRSPRDMLRFSAAVQRERLDVFFFPSVYTYFPLIPGLAAVVTVHDAIAERFPKLTLPSVRDRLFWKVKVAMALFQARLVLTVSDFAARELNEVLGVARKRIRVASEAPAAAYRPSDSEGEIAAAAARVGLPAGARWFVYVGGFNPHKNVDVLVRAHAALVGKDSSKAPYLLLVGATNGDVFFGDRLRIQSSIDSAQTSPFIRWTGFLPDEELRHLLTGAVALVLPSESEGFGLPAVEAAACGTPVIATTASPLPELLAGGGIFVRPGDEESLRDAMQSLVANAPLRRELGRRARECADRLSWSNGASAALDALREAAR
ncbi:MAG: glycosyltransferase family 4 protein [Gemmatimonadaceae bacterium]